jgi:hypothetical protein
MHNLFNLFFFFLAVFTLNFYNVTAKDVKSEEDYLKDIVFYQSGVDVNNIVILCEEENFNTTVKFVLHEPSPKEKLLWKSEKLRCDVRADIDQNNVFPEQDCNIFLFSLSPIRIDFFGHF